jgi:hypothetical protein
MTTMFMQQAATRQLHGSSTVKPFCLWANTVVPDIA